MNEQPEITEAAAQPAPQRRYNKRQLKIYMKEIAAALGESDEKPVRQIQSLLLLCGVDLVRELVANALQIDAEGGMMTSDGQRRRTVGGIFFQLARERLLPEERELVFYAWKVSLRERREREAQFPPLVWEDRVQQLEGKLTEKGEVSAVKVILYGQPGAVERRKDVVITMLEEQREAMPSIPAGVPLVPDMPMNYVVYISAKQWERVVSLVGNPDDPMLVEGYCMYDPEMNGLAVFATYVSTRKHDQRDKKMARAIRPSGDPKGAARRGDKPDKPADKAERHADRPAEKSAERPPEKPKGKKQEALPAQEAAPIPDFPIPRNVPPQVAQKFVELYTAAATFRQKVALLEAKPPDQQAGLEMTRKLLASTEKQIENLERQYAE